MGTRSDSTYLARPFWSGRLAIRDTRTPTADRHGLVMYCTKRPVAFWQHPREISCDFCTLGKGRGSISRALRSRYGGCSKPENVLLFATRVSSAAALFWPSESFMAEVIEINNIEDLAPYRMAWSSLLPETPGA